MKNILAFFTLGLLTSTSQAKIYHLITKSDLRQRITHQFLYEPSLKLEGFTHNATLNQVVPVANRHYKGMQDTLLLEIDEKLLKFPLRYDYVEKLGQHFPHIYGPINLSAVVRIHPMPVNSDGTYRLPKNL